MGDILKVEGLKKKHNGFELSDISFCLEPGCIMGLVGANGAGKTTLLHSILGLYQDIEGTVKVGDYDIISQPKEAKDLIAFVMEEEPFLEGMSPYENGLFYGRYYSKWNEALYSDYLKRFEVPYKKPLNKLSRGMRIKFQLAFALSHDGKLFIMDEPSAGLDPIFRRELTDILYDIISDGERSVLLSTHLTDGVDRIADYVTMLHKGRLVLSKSKEALNDSYRLIRASEKQLGYIRSKLLGIRVKEFYSEGLMINDGEPIFINAQSLVPTIEDLMEFCIMGCLTGEEKRTGKIKAVWKRGIV